MLSLPSSNNLEATFTNRSISVGFPWRLFLFSAFIFGLTLFVYFGLRFGYHNYLEAKRASLEKQTRGLGKDVNAAERNELIRFYSQFVNLKDVLADHRFASNIFAFLEQTTLPETYYTNASLAADTRKLTLQGKTRSIESLIGQINVFDESRDLENVSLGQIGLGKDAVSFSATLTVKQSFFKQPVP